jgi:glucosylceramidase
VTVDLKQSPAAVSYTGDYYGLGHASKFVHPGATRIDSTSFGKASLQTVAFQNPDGSIVLLVLNNESSTREFHVLWRGHELRTTLDSGALATYVWHS